MVVGLLAFGALCVGLGLWGLIWANKRRFERTNAYGVEQFASHGSALRSNVAEGLAKAVGGGLLILGLLSLLVAFVGAR